jgi:hypothetical protein
MALASSLGCPGRFMGVCSPNVFTFSAGIVDGISGVHTGPGATQFTRMPFSARSWANPPVKFWMAPYVVA